MRNERGITLVNAVTLTAVVGLLVLVSLPRLHAFAVQENEADAAALLRRLGQELAARRAAPGSPGAPGAPSCALRDLVDACGMDAAHDDLEWLEEGRTLRRHGYLFELTEHGDAHVLKAWPWCHGETGRSVFVATLGDGLLAHPNPGALWSGPDHPPEGPYLAQADWRPIP